MLSKQEILYLGRAKPQMAGFEGKPGRGIGRTPVNERNVWITFLSQRDPGTPLPQPRGVGKERSLFPQDPALHSCCPRTPHLPGLSLDQGFPCSLQAKSLSCSHCAPALSAGAPAPVCLLLVTFMKKESALCSHSLSFLSVPPTAGSSCVLALAGKHN